MSVDAVLIAGPTACGKSAAAIALAERLRGAIINADSMQVYSELRTLTARPSEKDEARVPHHLRPRVRARPLPAGRLSDEAARSRTRARICCPSSSAHGASLAALTESGRSSPSVPQSAQCGSAVSRTRRDSFLAAHRRDPAIAAS
jgi:tRNA dimethylallyltransferase